MAKKLSNLIEKDIYIFFIFSLSIGFLTLFIYYVFVKPSIQWIKQNFIVVSAIIILIILAIIMGIYFQIKRKKKYLSKLENQVYEEIKRFKPSKNYENEIGYHAELQGWLKRIFPQSKIEMQISSARPDIVIDNIAIEVKGPTDAHALDTLTSKCLRYSIHYESMIIVLFNPTVSEKYYDDITDGIKVHFPNVRVIVK